MSDYATAKPLLIIVMGPASCGKSTIGSELATGLGIPFIDGDALHPAANVAKMTAGHPLNDEDRLPWLQIIRATGEEECKKLWDSGVGKDAAAERKEGKLGRPAVAIACSALKKYYRDILRGDVEAKNAQPPKMQTIFVYCYGSPALLAERIAARKNHFMAPSMLQSQLAALEDPSGEPGVTTVDIAASREEVARRALAGTREIVQQMDARGQ